MEKRVVIFLVLSLAVILGYDFLLKQLGLLPTAPPPSEETISQTSLREGKPSSDVGNNVAPPGVNVPPSLVGGSVSGTSLTPRASSEAIVVVETELVRVGVDPRGGVISTWELKHYKSTVTESNPVQLVYEGGKFRRPLSITTGDAALDKALQEGLFSVESDGIRLDASHPVGRVTLRYQDPGTGVNVLKRLTFHHDSYVVDVTVAIEGGGNPYDVVLGTNFGIVEWGDGLIGQIGAASLVDGKVEKEIPDHELERTGAVEWVALQDKYFLAVLLPEGAKTLHVKKEGEKLLSASVRAVSTSNGTDSRFRLYAGPKEYDTLRSLNVGLEDTIDFGWFIFGSWSLVKAVAKPIFYVLRFITEYTHNYGVTIILLTMGIKLLFVPLQYKSYKSMKQMQVIQPKVLTLQEKYKEDRDRLNKELIKLYRDHKVNPVGGCLPMVLQMPVFVALFNILYMTIDLRQAPFVGWITDLSVQDPYYVLPIIMGVTMVVQQKITPTTMDPAQAKIMLMLPAFMTFLFINFPAGLVLYWLTNNVLTITQQIVTDRVVFGNESLVVEPVK